MTDDVKEERSETHGVEQITKEPKRDESYAARRVKDPKRVAAGKKLAEKNKQMREEHAKYKALESQRENTPDTPEQGNLLSQLTLTNIISLVGIGLTVYTIFFKKPAEPKEEWQRPVHTTFEEVEPKRDVVSRDKPKSKTKPKPRFGM